MLPALALGGMALGAGMSGLGSIMGNRATRGAQRDLNRAGQQLTSMYQPYINYGQEAMPTLREQYGKLLNNPQEIYGQLAGGYQKSPGYDFRMQEMQNALSNAMGAGGMLGTSGHQMEAMKAASGIAGGDFDKYLSTMLGLYGTGLEGTQGQFNTDANMMQGLGGNLTGLRGSSAQLGYTGGQNMGQALGGLGGMMMNAPSQMALIEALQKGMGGGMMNNQMGGYRGGMMQAPGQYQYTPVGQMMNQNNSVGFGLKGGA